uniref:Uncharacterized protein n=1 Tax=Ditylenchus dipsaci TaxID=166011 RepID=A0A915EWJ6_9BILA
MRTTENDEEDQFQVEFDSSDDEGREEEKARQKHLEKRRNCDKDSSPIMKTFKNKEKKAREKNEDVNSDSSALTDFSTMKVSGNGNYQNHSTLADLDRSPSAQPNLDVWSSGDEDETKATGIPKQDLFAEFVSMMEQRFWTEKMPSL